MSTESISPISSPNIPPEVSKKERVEKSVHKTSSIRLPIKQRGEIIDRIHESAIKNKFSPNEQKLLIDAMLNPEAIITKTRDEFESTVTILFREFLVDNNYKSEEIKIKTDQLANILEDVKPFNVTLSPSKPKAIPIQDRKLIIKER